MLGTQSRLQQQCLGTEVFLFRNKRTVHEQEQTFLSLGQLQPALSCHGWLEESCCRMQECLTVGFLLEIDLGPVCINTLMLNRIKELSKQWFNTLELEYFL